MVNSWDFTQKLSTDNILRIAYLLRDTGVYIPVKELNSQNIYIYIAGSLDSQSDEPISYFDYLAFCCDQFSIPLSWKVQEIEERLLLYLFHEMANGLTDATLRAMADNYKISYEGKKKFIETISMRFKSSSSFREGFASSLLDKDYLSNFFMENKMLEILALLIQQRWRFIRPFSTEEACDYVLNHIKDFDGNLSDYQIVCQLLALLVSSSKGDLPTEILRLQEQEGLKMMSFPEVIKDKLVSHSDAIINMLMKRIGNKSEEDIELLLKANEMVESGKRILFAEYCFPYSKIMDGCQYLKKADHLLANSIYIFYKLGKTVTSCLIDKQKITGQYDYIVCQEKDEDELRKYGQLLVLDRIASPYLKYEELSQQLLPLFTMSVSEMRKEMVKAHDAKEFAKLLERLSHLKEQALLAQNSLARIRHDYSADLGVLNDYIEEYSVPVDELEREDARCSYQRICAAIGKIGKDPSFERLNLYEVIKECIETDKENGRKYCIKFEYEVCQAYSSIDKEEFSVAVIGNIFTNALKHGFVLNRPVDKNVILLKLIDAGDTWCISIMNNGAPYKGEVNKIFEKGYRAGITGGTGEGMHSVYTTMLSMGGYVTFKSIQEAEYPVVITINIPKIYE